MKDSIFPVKDILLISNMLFIYKLKITTQLQDISLPIENRQRITKEQTF